MTEYQYQDDLEGEFDHNDCKVYASYNALTLIGAPICYDTIRAALLASHTLTAAAAWLYWENLKKSEGDAVDDWVHSIDPATGVETHGCILSVQANPDEFLQINLSQVDPKACFRRLKGVASSKLAELTPVRPIAMLNKDDHRFVEAYSVIGDVDARTNLASMDWVDFENLIRELFEKEFSKNGGEGKITQASRDGGVDAIAFDPDPIRGGKIVIQAKRYTNVVGVSTVRDLYGTVHNEGANKGILVTTSTYGPDAYEFAKGKPLTLLSGNELLSLLGQHGHKAKIDLKEAKALAAGNAARST
jgi:restriction system protein